MYLQSLEMIGFKSFAPRTVLNLHRGVTAIVGPNGCGKSNVLDAIRWALGEQSAKALRGGEMADVIFGGTDSRAALGMAEVSLTFADCEKDLGVEWNEVRITRRVFRDGRSEYLLNNTPCRLRDIHELFMDTGVGRSAYSIMEQGKIDLILSSRPEDRRAIFEEAAGITKYKAQKKEALRKLEYTEANLLRVQDIVKEVKRQIGSLQRQAAKARRYQALQADLRVLDTHLSARNYTAMRADLDGLREAMRGLDEAREIHVRETREQELELDEFRRQLATREEEIAGVREAAQEIRNRLFAAENRLGINAERAAEGRSLIERHEADIAGAEERMGVQRDEIAATEQQIAEMVGLLREREAELAVREATLGDARAERVKAETAIAELAGEAARLEARLSSLRGELSAAAGRREAAETRQRLIAGEECAARAAGAESAARLAALESGRAQTLARLDAAQATLAQAGAAQEAAQKHRQEAEYALNQASKQAASVESRLEVLRQLQEHGEGLAEGTQALLRGLNDPAAFRPAVLGALADRIRVEPEFIPAIEAALGNALQTVLYTGAADAKAAIAALGLAKLGRGAAAAPSTHRRLPDLSHELPDGALCWAADRVGGLPEARELAAALLERTVLASDLDAAWAVREVRPELAVATLAGEFIDRHGICFGGQTGESNGQSALARRAQIEGLGRELDEAIAVLEARTAERARAVEEVDAAQQRLIAAREAVQAAQVDAAAQENEVNLCRRQSADFEARIAAFLREAAQLADALRESQSALEEIESATTACVTSLDEARQQRSRAEAAAHIAREREASAAEDLNEVRVAVATGRQQRDSLASQRKPMDARLAELAELLASRRREVEGIVRRLSELEEQNAGLAGTIEAGATELAGAEERSATATAARDELRSHAEAVETALRNARSQLMALQEQKGAIEVRAAQVTMRMEHLRDHVSQRYHSDLENFGADSYAFLAVIRERSKRLAQPAENDAEPTGGPPATAEPEPATPETGACIAWDRVEALVADLTERIESMGPVNVEAIQEFEELEQRHLFLEKQNADLVNSKVELLEVIAKINRTTKELFADTFAKIRDNFRVMFADLFGGGQASLELLDASDPLECGIEIVAKPPGKQLKSVSLLSGGERTMTAVALLFAIYMVKPSPFCVLDEMDAPLDESNISRFIKILDRFVDQSQFVVITHNKRTISRAEMLYGVTMEEHGISKLVSVRFSESTQGTPGVAASLGKSDQLHSESMV